MHLSNNVAVRPLGLSARSVPYRKYRFDTAMCVEVRRRLLLPNPGRDLYAARRKSEVCLKELWFGFLISMRREAAMGGVEEWNRLPCKTGVGLIGRTRCEGSIGR